MTRRRAAKPMPTGWRRIALASALVLATGAGVLPLPPPTGAAPCWRLIQQFDALVVDRYDHRLFGVETHELAEARSWRDQAEIDCGAHHYDFGREAIEAALEQIGVPPGPSLVDWFRE